MIAEHPRYRGEVIDAHCHYDASTRARVRQVNQSGGLTAAVHLWDCRWPPAQFEVDAPAWLPFEPALLRCHVPDFSNVGAPGFERALERDLRVAADRGAVGVKVWKNLGLWLRDTSGRRIARRSAIAPPSEWPTSAAGASPSRSTSRPTRSA